MNESGASPEAFGGAVELTAQERETLTTGEGLLKSIAKEGQQVILGPDGKAVEPSVLVTDPAAAPKTEVDATVSEAELRRKALEQHMHAESEKKRREIEDATTTLKQIVDENSAVEKCAQVMLVAHRMVMWAKLEMELLDQRMDGKLLHYAESVMQRKAYTEGGFPVKRLVMDLRNNVLQFIDERRQEQDSKAQKRQMSLKLLLKRLKNGVSLPSEDMRKQLKGQPWLAGTFVVYGNAEAVATALQYVGSSHSKTDHVPVYYLPSDEATLPELTDFLVMAPSWWKNGCSSLYRTNEMLEPVLESKALMICIENMNDLMDGGAIEPWRVRGQILNNLQHFAVENFAAILLGDVTDEQITDPNYYGGLSYIQARIERKDGKLFLLLGNDPFELEE